MDYCMNVPGFVDSLLILGGNPFNTLIGAIPVA